MLHVLARHLTGYLEVAVTGSRPEAFVNLAVATGLDLWDVRRSPTGLVAHMRLRDFFRVRPLARRARCRVRVSRRRGLPFWLRRVRRRWGLALGAALCGAAVLWLSSHIWFIQVRGAVQVDHRAVRAGLAQLGLRPGAWRWQVDVARIERDLPRLVPEVGWLTVRLEGVRAVVEVVERATVRPAGNPGRVDLVAGKDNCVVEEVITFAGMPVVRTGAVPRAGEVLIEGILYEFTSPPVRGPFTPPEAWPPRPDKPVGVLRAEGQVWARCYYTGYAEVPLWYEERVPTGRRATQVVLRWHGREILLKGPPQSPYAAYDVARWTLAVPPAARNWLPAVEISTVTFTEVTVRRHPRDLESARAEVAADFTRRLAWHLVPGQDRLLNVEVQPHVRTGGALGLRILAVTREQIARPRPGPPAVAPEGGGPAPDSSNPAPPGRSSPPPGGGNPAAPGGGNPALPGRGAPATPGGGSRGAPGAQAPGQPGGGGPAPRQP